jgi:hypothetical protein
LNVANPIQLLRGIVTFALVGSLTGCCFSYGRVAVVDRSSARNSLDVRGLVIVVENAVRPLGFKGSAERSYYPQITLYSVVDPRNDLNRLNVAIDNQTLSIKLGWDWHTKADFAASVQNAIEREFSASYGNTLQFKEHPCERLAWP